MNINEIIESLKKPVEPEWLDKLPKRNNKAGSTTYVEFVPWYNVCELLDARIGLGAWQWEIKDTTILTNNRAITAESGEVVMVSDNQVSVVGKLTIYADDCTRTYEAIGIESINCGSYGDPTSNATAMALRRAAAYAGLARELWDKSKRTSNNKSFSSNVVIIGSKAWQVAGRKHYIQKGLDPKTVAAHLNSSGSKEEFKRKCEQSLMNKAGSPPQTI